MAAVIAVAVSTISGLVFAQMMPTRMEKSSVKAIMIGRPYFCKVSEKQPIKIDSAISKTETIIIAALFIKTFLKLSDFIAQTQIKAVIIS